MAISVNGNGSNGNGSALRELDAAAAFAGVRTELSEIADVLDRRLTVCPISDRVAALDAAYAELGVEEISAAFDRGVLASVRDAFARMRSDSDLPRELPVDMVALVRTWAAHGGHLVKLQDLFAAAGDRIWEELYDAIEDVVSDPGARWQLARQVRDYFGRYRAWTAPLTAAVYLAAAGSPLGSRCTDRTRRVLRLLEGAAVTSAELGYDLSSEHLAAVAWGREPVVALKRLAAQSGRQLLTAARPDGCLWGWLGGHTSLSSSAVTGLLSAHDRGAGCIALGEPESGVDGFKLSHAQAVEAHAVAVTTGESAVRYDDIALTAFAGRDPRLAAAFVEHELGGLLAGDARTRELLDTLSAYLSHANSLKATSAVLGVHRDTVRRHLEAIEARLRYPISERAAELQLALRLLPLMPRLTAPTTR